MPDNWSFVLAAYGLAVIMLGGYWRHLRRRERALAILEQRSRVGQAGSEPRAPGAGPPRREPSSRSPRQ